MVIREYWSCVRKLGMSNATEGERTYGKHSYGLSHFMQHSIVILSGIFIVVLYSVLGLWIYGYD